jgi:hypothetical protein
MKSFFYILWLPLEVRLLFYSFDLHPQLGYYQASWTPGNNLIEDEDQKSKKEDELQGEATRYRRKNRIRLLF